MTPNNRDNYVSLVMIPRKLLKIFIWLFSIIVISYTLIQLTNKWELKIFGDTFPKQVSTLMSLTVGYLFVLSNIWSGVMLLYDWISAREKIKQQAKAERDLQWIHWAENVKDPDKMPSQVDPVNVSDNKKPSKNKTGHTSK